MKHTYMGSSGRIVLRPLSEEDSYLSCTLRNKYKKFFFSQQDISFSDQKKWYEEYLEKDDDIMFSIYKDQLWIGSVALYSIDRQKGEAEFGRLMIDGSIDCTKGCGLDATVCICRIGFEQMGLSNINLEVYSDNIPAFKTYERAGFCVTAKRVSNGREVIAMTLTRETFNS